MNLKVHRTPGMSSAIAYPLLSFNGYARYTPDIALRYHVRSNSPAETLAAYSLTTPCLGVAPA